MSDAQILCGDCRDVLKTLPNDNVHCIVTSPPYWGLRDYGVAGQIGLEPCVNDWVDQLLEVFRECRRVLRADGTLWLNLGDAYANDGKWGGETGGKQAYLDDANRQRVGRHKRHTGLKPKDLIGAPWRVAFALQADGWWLRSAIVWAKPNCMPGSQDDRPTSSYENFFLLTKSESYWSDFDSIKTPPRESSLIRTAQDVQAQAGSHCAHGGKKTNGHMKAVGVRRSKQGDHPRRTHAGFNERWDSMSLAEQQSMSAMMRDVWFVAPEGYCDDITASHYAVMPREIARRCVLAGCPLDGVVLDPFNGSGTTGEVALSLGRKYIGIELNPDYVELTRRRLSGVTMGLPLETAA